MLMDKTSSVSMILTLPWFYPSNLVIIHPKNSMYFIFLQRQILKSLQWTIIVVVVCEFATVVVGDIAIVVATLVMIIVAIVTVLVIFVTIVVIATFEVITTFVTLTDSPPPAATSLSVIAVCPCSIKPERCGQDNTLRGAQTTNSTPLAAGPSSLPFLPLSPSTASTPSAFRGHRLLDPMCSFQ